MRKDAYLRVRLTEQQSKALDVARGKATRSEFVRKILRERLGQ